MGLDLPRLTVGPDVDVATLETEIAIPPVMLNSHVSNLGQTSKHLRGAIRRKFLAARSEPHCLIRWIWSA